MSDDNNINNSSQANKFKKSSTPISSKRNDKNLPNCHNAFDDISGIFDTYEIIKNEVSFESSCDNFEFEIERLTDLKARCSEISKNIQGLDDSTLHFVNNKRNSVDKLILKQLLGINLNLNLWDITQASGLMISSSYTYPFFNITLQTLCGAIQITSCESLVIDLELIDRIINVLKLNTQNLGFIA